MTNFEVIESPSDRPETKWININGRAEHESILRDEKKMHELGLDPIYEKMVYLKRWGSWINGCVDYSGKMD